MTFKKIQVVLYTGEVGKTRPTFKSVIKGDEFETEDEFLEALHDTLDDEVDCMTEKLEGN